MSDFSRLRGNERYEVCGDEAGVWPRRNGGIFSKKFRTKHILTLGMLIFQGLEGFVHTFHK